MVREHDGIFVVRDDLSPGGTKARFLWRLYRSAPEVVYASPAQGGAQFALAHCARMMGGQATIFVAKRHVPHPRQLEAKRLGARVMLVSPGYLAVVQSRARDYVAQDAGRLLVPFGADMPWAMAAIAAAARQAEIEPPDEVWCAAGSGVLSRALAQAWPNARRHAVQVGRALSPRDVAGAIIHTYDLPFERHARSAPPFPSDPHYDAKAWEICRRERGPGRCVFWNVTGPAHP